MRSKYHHKSIRGAFVFYQWFRREGKKALSCKCLFITIALHRPGASHKFNIKLQQETKGDLFTSENTQKKTT